MATVKQYAIQLWQTQKTVSQKLGADIASSDTTSRVVAVTSDVMLAGLIKILVDKGVITNQDLTAAYTAITNASFPQLGPVVPLSMGEGNPVPDPDLGA